MYGALGEDQIYYSVVSIAVTSSLLPHNKATMLLSLASTQDYEYRLRIPDVVSLNVQLVQWITVRNNESKNRVPIPSGVVIFTYT